MESKRRAGSVQRLRHGKERRDANATCHQEDLCMILTEWKMIAWGADADTVTDLRVVMCGTGTASAIRFALHGDAVRAVVVRPSA